MSHGISPFKWISQFFYGNPQTAGDGCLWLGSAFLQRPHLLSVRLRWGCLVNSTPPWMHLVFHLGQRLSRGPRSKCAHEKLPGETKQCHSTGAVLGLFSRCAHLPLFLGYTMVRAHHQSNSPYSVFFKWQRTSWEQNILQLLSAHASLHFVLLVFTLSPLFQSSVPSVLLFLSPEKSLQWLSPSNLTESDYSLFSCWVNKITPLRSIINNPFRPSSLLLRHNLLTSFL